MRLIRTHLNAPPWAWHLQTDAIPQNPPWLMCTFPTDCRLQRRSQTCSLRSRYGTSQILMPSEVCFHGNHSHASIPLRWDTLNTCGEKKIKNTLAPPRCINMKREAASAPRSKAGGDTILLLSWTEPPASFFYRWLPFNAGTKINKNSLKKRSHVRVVFKNPPPSLSQIRKMLLTNRKRQRKMQLRKGMESNIRLHTL